MSIQAPGFHQTPDVADGAEPLGAVRVGDLARTVVKTVRSSRGGQSRAGRLTREGGPCGRAPA